MTFWGPVGSHHGLHLHRDENEGGDGQGFPNNFNAALAGVAAYDLVATASRGLAGPDGSPEVAYLGSALNPKYGDGSVSGTPGSYDPGPTGRAVRSDHPAGGR